MSARAHTLRTEQHGRVLTVRIDNPPRNLFDERVGADLAALVRGLERDNSVRAVVLTSASDETFVTRYDTTEILRDTHLLFRPLSWRQAQGVTASTRALRYVPGLERLLRGTPARGLVNLHRLNATFRRMNRMDTVFVAAINGMAVGGGLLIPLACDFRLIADDAGPVGLPEAAIGIVPAIGGTQRTTRAIGTARALELLLEAPHLRPPEAAALGIVHRVVPRDQLLVEAYALAERLAHRPPGVNRAIKRLAYEAGSRPLAAATRMEEAGVMAMLSTPGARRAIRAFTERLGKPGETDADQIEAYRLALGGKLLRDGADSGPSAGRPGARQEAAASEPLDGR